MVVDSIAAGINNFVNLRKIMYVNLLYSTVHPSAHSIKHPSIVLFLPLISTPSSLLLFYLLVFKLLYLMLFLLILCRPPPPLFVTVSDSDIVISTHKLVMYSTYRLL